MADERPWWDVAGADWTWPQPEDQDQGYPRQPATETNPNLEQAQKDQADYDAMLAARRRDAGTPKVSELPQGSPTNRPLPGSDTMGMLRDRETTEKMRNEQLDRQYYPYDTMRPHSRQNAYRDASGQMVDPAQDEADYLAYQGQNRDTPDKILPKEDWLRQRQYQRDQPQGSGPNEQAPQDAVLGGGTLQPTSDQPQADVLGMVGFDRATQPSPEPATQPAQPPAQSPFTSPPPATLPPLPAQGAAPGETPPPAAPEPPKPPKMLWHAEDGFTPTRAQAEVEKVHQRNLEAMRQGRPGNNEVSRETHDQALRDQEAQQRGLPRDVTLNQTQLDELHRRADQTVKLPRGQRRDIAVAAMAAHFIQQEQHNRERAVEYEMQERHTRAHEMAMAKMDAAKDVRQDKALEAKDRRQEKIEIAREKRAEDADRRKLEQSDRMGQTKLRGETDAQKDAAITRKIAAENTARAAIEKRVQADLKRHQAANVEAAAKWKLDGSKGTAPEAALPDHLKTPEAMAAHIEDEVDKQMVRHYKNPEASRAFAGFLAKMPKNPQGGPDLMKASQEQLQILERAVENHHVVGLSAKSAEELRADIEKMQKQHAERQRVYDDMRTNRMGTVDPTARPSQINPVPNEGAMSGQGPIGRSAATIGQAQMSPFFGGHR